MVTAEQLSLAGLIMGREMGVVMETQPSSLTGSDVLRSHLQRPDLKRSKRSRKEPIRGSHVTDEGRVLNTHT